MIEVKKSTPTPLVNWSAPAFVGVKKENTILPSRKMSDKEFEDSILNAYICEMSEGMMSLSHVG